VLHAADSRAAAELLLLMPVSQSKAVQFCTVNNPLAAVKKPALVPDAAAAFPSARQFKNVVAEVIPLNMPPKDVPVTLPTQLATPHNSPLENADAAVLSACTSAWHHSMTFDVAKGLVFAANAALVRMTERPRQFVPFWPIHTPLDVCVICGNSLTHAAGWQDFHV
jgi:hypothetical protein